MATLYLYLDFREALKDGPLLASWNTRTRSSLVVFCRHTVLNDARLRSFWC